MPARRAIKLFTNRTGTVHGKNLVTTEKDERNICVYKRITVSLSIYACAGRGRGVAKGERRRREGRVRGREQSSSVNVSGSGPATGHPTRLLTDINTRVPTHTHPSTHTYVMAGRPPAYSYALSECVSLCVCVCLWGGEASDFPIYNYNFIVFTIFSSLWPRIELTQTQTWTQTVRLWEWEGSEYRRQDRTQSTHSLVNAGQRQKLLLMCSNVYVPIRMFVCMGKGGDWGRGKVAWYAFFCLFVYVFVVYFCLG